MQNDIEIKLTADEAWVLFEFTRRYVDTEKLSITDQSEQRALWNLCCVFEKSLHQESELSYTEHVERCRERLRDETI